MSLFDSFKKQFGQASEQAEPLEGDKTNRPKESAAGQPVEQPAPPTASAADTSAPPTPGRDQLEAGSGLDDGLERKSYPIVAPGSTEEQIKGALRQIYDPEIGLEVVQLGLIREINLGQNPAEIKMMLTTPFCPYGGWLIQQVKDVSESVVGRPVKIDVLPDLWDINLMEDPGLLSGW